MFLLGGNYRITGEAPNRVGRLTIYLGWASLAFMWWHGDIVKWCKIRYRMVVS